MAAEEEEERRAFAESVGADSTGSWGSSMLPPMTRPAVTLACLPGNRWMLRAALPRFVVNPGGRVLTTRVRASDTGGAAAAEAAAGAGGEGSTGLEESFGDRLVRTVVDRHGRLAEVGLLAPSAPAALNLSRVVGLPMAWLRDFERDLRTGRSRDLVWQLEQPWAAMVLHHQFASEVEAARAAMRGGAGADSAMSDEVVSYVRDLMDRVASGAAADSSVTASDSKDPDEEQDAPPKEPPAAHPEALRAQLLGGAASKVPLEVRRALELRTIRFLRARRDALPRFFVPGIH
jgi:hypothetical protein